MNIIVCLELVPNNYPCKPYHINDASFNFCMLFPSSKLVLRTLDKVVECIDQQLSAKKSWSLCGPGGRALQEGIFYCMSNTVIVSEQRLEHKYSLAGPISTAPFLSYPSPGCLTKAPPSPSILVTYLFQLSLSPGKKRRKQVSVARPLKSITSVSLRFAGHLRMILFLSFSRSLHELTFVWPLLFLHRSKKATHVGSCSSDPAKSG